MQEHTTMKHTNKGKVLKWRAYSSGRADIMAAIYGGYSRNAVGYGTPVLQVERRGTDAADKKDPPNHTEGQDHEHDE